MAISHALASGMGGMRAAGDLVARMQMTRGMKINKAKAYVADKLRVSVSDLSVALLSAGGTSSTPAALKRTPLYRRNLTQNRPPLVACRLLLFNGQSGAQNRE